MRRAYVALVALFVLYHMSRLGIYSRHIGTSTSGRSSDPSPVRRTHSFLPVEPAQELCATQNLTVFPRRDHHRKIYDLFLMGTELDWLEIRLHELGPHVDYFVIVESTRTFTNRPKPLYFMDNARRFAAFAPQIIHRRISHDGMEHRSTWEREEFQRNSLFEAVFPGLAGPLEPEFGDVILVSDVDEIPRPSTINLLRNCMFPSRVTLQSRFFYYSFQWEHAGSAWDHPQATFYQADTTIRPQDLRKGASDGVILNASWHCSSCFDTVAQVTEKIRSFSHSEYDRAEFRDPARIVRRVRNGLDLFDRDGEVYDKVDARTDLPAYVKANEERFSFMIDRDPPNANFRDYHPPLPLD